MPHLMFSICLCMPFNWNMLKTKGNKITFCVPNVLYGLIRPCNYYLMIEKHITWHINICSTILMYERSCTYFLFYDLINKYLRHFISSSKVLLTYFTLVFLIYLNSIYTGSRVFIWNISRATRAKKNFLAIKI